MAPSRGFNALLRARIRFPLQNVRQYSDFVSAATNPSNKSQVYISRTLDPYLNLSIEHYLLQKTPADSTILFLYTNRPSVIIGRNQNPWTEVNLGVLRNEDLGVQLVRRRSGGGTVFHDEGNVNYSVIMPTLEFDRDMHAEMVVRALRSLGVEKARVNERHDIVVDKKVPEGAKKPFKISGSAYKITRMRSLHHGTCLLSSPNIHSISRYLRAPAKPYIKARGVESVSSRITNVGLENERFEQAVMQEFVEMYGAADPVLVDEDQKEVSEIKKGFEELMSNDWIYGQTPQFTFASNNKEDDEIAAENRLWEFPRHVSLDFTARNGEVKEMNLSYKGDPLISASFKNKKLYEIADWKQALSNPFNRSTLPSLKRTETRAILGRVMNELFGNGGFGVEEYIRPWGLSDAELLEMNHRDGSKLW